MSETEAARDEADRGFASLDGLNAVVTGSSSGIGREIALEFGRAGANVIVHCRESLEAAQEIAADIRSMGRLAAVVQGDIRNREVLQELIESSWSCFSPIDVWVNNAGVDLLTGDSAKLPYDEKLQQLLQGDVTSTVLLSKAVGHRMLKEGGCILNVGWDQAERGMEGDSGELFAASKNAIMGYTRSLAVSLAPSVRVNCIAPGWIRTSWGEDASENWQRRVLRETPAGRWGMPDDVAKLARFLVSPDASYITGQVINCNGGAVR